MPNTAKLKSGCEEWTVKYPLPSDGRLGTSCESSFENLALGAIVEYPLAASDPSAL